MIMGKVTDERRVHRMDAVTGRVARVDLSIGRIDVELIPDEGFKKFLGGRGLAAKIMLEKIARIAPV